MKRWLLFKAFTSKTAALFRLTNLTNLTCKIERENLPFIAVPRWLFRGRGCLPNGLGGRSCGR